MGHIGHYFSSCKLTPKKRIPCLIGGGLLLFMDKKRDTVKCPHNEGRIRKKVKDKKGDFVRF
jgi:hypothetical protein